MTNQVEIIDRKRRTILKTYLVGAVIFFMSWFTRFILRETGVLTETVDWAIAVPFVIGLGILLYSFVRLMQVRKRIASDPALRDALNDELVRLNNLSAFRFGFFAMMGGLAFLAAFNFFSPVKDFNAAILTIFMVGSWACLLAFYRLERR